MEKIEINQQIKKHACDFCTWFMQLLPEDLTYYIVEEGSGNPIPQYYSREEMYDKFIEVLPELK
jgi:hypothetical protein